MKEMSCKNQRILFIALIAAIAVFDQVVKYEAVWVLQTMPGGRADFIPGFMNLVYMENTGAAFSLFSNATWLLALVSAVLAGVVMYLLFRYVKIKSWLYKLSLCFISGGAVGNLLDRAFRGFVVDMLEFDFVDFAIFNAADSFVCVGAVMLGIFVIWVWDKSRKETGNED
jgi:signal peptidase II